MKGIGIEIKWALLFALMTLIWMWLERISGLHTRHIDKHLLYTNLIAIPAIAIYVFALLDKRKNYYHGTMTYRQGFITGLILTFIITLLSPLTQYITSTFISPEYFPNVITYSVEQGEMTRQGAEDYFNLRSYIMQGLLGAPIMGIATTAVVAAFVRKKDVNK